MAQVRTLVPTAHRRRAALLPALAGSVLALATGCGGATAPSTPAAPPASSAPAEGTGAATTVTVTETDFKIALDPPSPAAGPHTFHVVNAGQAPHALELEGPGIEEQKTAVLQPGQSADLAATLQDGDYDLYCPVDGHRAMGMELSLTVGAADGDDTPEPPSGGGSGY
jgi:plastocyanin